MNSSLPSPSPWSVAVRGAVAHDLDAFGAALSELDTLVSQRLPLEAAASCQQLLAFARAKALADDWAEAAHILRYLRRCWREGEQQAQKRTVYRAA